MNRSTKVIIVAGVVICFILIPLGLYVMSEQNKTHQDNSLVAEPTRTKEDLLSATARALPDYSENGKPTFEIVSYKNPIPRWYVVTIKMIGDTTNNYAKVLLYDSTETKDLSLMLGPGTAFNQEELAGKGIPSSLIEDLN
jgi:hypothetical protein